MLIDLHIKDFSDQNPLLFDIFNLSRNNFKQVEGIMKPDITFRVLPGFGQAVIPVKNSNKLLFPSIKANDHVFPLCFRIGKTNQVIIRSEVQDSKGSHVQRMVFICFPAESSGESVDILLQFQ